MKKLWSMLLAVVMLCGMCVVPAGAEESEWDKYIGTYSIPESYGRPWFGFELEIFEINDAYVDYDFTYSNMGHAAAFEEDRAYFINEYIAEGNGRSGYADETERKDIENRLTFYDDHIHFDTTGLFGGGLDFYPTVSEKFVKSKKEVYYGTDAFYLICDHYYVNVSDKTLRIIDIETYNTVFTENNVSWNFISDGNTVYYHNWKTLKKLDLKSLHTETVFAEMNMLYLRDIFENRYILYEDSLEQYTSECNSYVYDMYTGDSYLISEYSLDGGFTKSGRVVTMGLTGEVSPIDLMVSDIDGKNQKVVSDMMMAYSYYIKDECIYYADLLTDSYDDMCFVVKKYDSVGNTIEILTDKIHNAVDVDVTDSYVEYIDASDGYYKNKPKVRMYYDRKNVVISSITVTLNGDELQFDQPPIIKDDRTLVPMRAIFEAMGCDVEWDGELQQVDVYKNGDNVMTLLIDEYEMWTENGYITLDVPPQIIGERTLVPVRAISEALDCDVDWDGDTRTVGITAKEDLIKSKMVRIYQYDDKTLEKADFEKTIKLNDTEYNVTYTQTEKYDWETDNIDRFEFAINGSKLKFNDYFEYYFTIRDV